MPIFLEKLVLPVLAAAVTILIFVNPMKFDWRQRLSLFIAVIALAYFISHSLYIRNEGIRPGLISSTQPEASSPAKQPSSAQSAPSAAAPVSHVESISKPRKQLPKFDTLKLKSPLASISDGQRFVLKQKLGAYPGRTVRLVLIGNDPSTAIAFEELIDVFKDSGWKIENVQIGMVGVVGLNFPNGPYMTSQDMASRIVATVFSIFSGAGVDLPLAPNAFMGPGAAGGSPDIVIVVH